MKSPNHNKFQADAEKIVFDRTHRGKIRFNMSKYKQAVAKGRERYVSFQNARLKAEELKEHAINNLHDYLIEFENNFTKNGGIVHWATNKEEAISIISKILTENNVKTVVKSKSMTTEEIDFNEEVEKMGVTSIESDLGEYIVQLAGEKPYHIVTPAMHKSKNDVAQLFNEKFDFPLDSTAEEMTALARKNLRDIFINADAGITGANFIIPDIGGIAITENEGNAIMTTSFPPIHIAIAGIEKVIPKFEHLALFWPHLALNGTGQAITVYNSVFSGPKKTGELHGPEQMHVVLLDNGRTNLYKNKKFRKALTCIRCGACLNACPIYKNVGGYTYATTYQGPIGTVISPHLNTFDEFGHLSFACSLCGNCSEVCPVKIPLHNLIIHNRKLSVENKSSISDNLAMSFFSKMMKKRSVWDVPNNKAKDFGFRLVGQSKWGKYKRLPRFSEKSFRNSYRQKKK
jgi:L-lactate dehydrogenase complex protein LldF